MAKDRFDREIDYLRISITDRCNLGCIYCMPGKRPHGARPDEVLTGEEVVRIVRVAKQRFGVRKVRLTGGEPLLRPDLLDIVRGIKATGLRDLSLTTNGTELAARAPEIKDAGIDRLNISLDSLKAERYREMTDGGSLDVVLEGIAQAERVGIEPVKINMVPIRGINDDEIEDFARLTLEKPYHVRFIEFMPSGRERLWDDTRCIKSDEIRSRVEAIGRLRKLRFRGKGPSRNYRLDDGPGVIGFISPVSHSFCYSCNRLRINAIGKIRPCLFARESVDLLGPLRGGASDEELALVILRAIEIKPEGNFLQGPGRTSIRSMSSIGG
jgi:cyclic pyranopterin phosphate synthase